MVSDSAALRLGVVMISGPADVPAVRPQRVLDLEAKHGLPARQIPGTVYALHYDPPRVIRSVSGDYAGPRAAVGLLGLAVGRADRALRGVDPAALRSLTSAGPADQDAPNPPVTPRGRVASR